jgi:hypothetical protein
MSEEMEPQAATPPQVHRRTIADAQRRDQAETEGGFEVAFYVDGEDKPENYLGSVWANNGQKAYLAKLDRLKQSKGKGKAYQWSDAELRPLRERAEVGTYWVRITGWLEEDGSEIPSTEENIARIMQFGFVARKCTVLVTDEATWEALAKEALGKN